MLILGIDPSSVCTGWGIIRADRGRYDHVSHGTIKPGKVLLPQKLLFLHDGIEEILRNPEPDDVSQKLDAVFVEMPFVHPKHSMQTALIMGQVVGVVVLALVAAHHECVMLSPAEAKKAVTGNGNADKAHVQRMVKAILKMKEPPTPYDASDALAVAIAGAQKGTEVYR